MLKDIVKILLHLSKTYESVSDNLVLEVIEKHPNKKYFAEILALIISKAQYKVDTSGHEFVQAFHGFASTALFYKNDMHMLIDALLEQIKEIMAVKEHGLIILGALEELVKTEDYAKSKYRLADIEELQKLFKSMGSLGQVRKDNYELFKKIVVSAGGTVAG